MGFFDSSSSSSTTNNTDRRLAVDTGAGITGDSNIMSFTTSNVTTDAGSIQAALKANEAASAAATAAASKAVSDTLAAGTRMMGDSYSFSTGVSDNAFSLADRAQGFASKTAADVLGMSSHVVDQAFLFNENLRKSSDALTSNAVQQVARAYDTATNYQADKATTDSRYLVIAGLIVVGLAVIKGTK